MENKEGDQSSLSAEAVVQEELQRYLSEKGVNSLFIKIVEQLLMDKPENPIAFIVEYLKKNFPKETEHLSLQSSTSESRKDDSEETTCDETKDEDESSDEDELVDLPVFEPRKTQNTTRRASVSAAVFSQMQMNTEEQHVFPKSLEDAARLKEILSKTMLCSHLDEGEQKTIVDAMEKVEFESGVEIITQGDLKADHYYVLERGKAIVLKDGEQVHQYADGSDFGELALMYNAPRAATVKSTTDCVTWRLDQKVFKTIIVHGAMQKRKKFMEFLCKVPMFQEMKEVELSILADTLKRVSYKSGTEIVKQADSGDEFFIIEEGIVNVVVDGECIGDLKEGHYFGEIALLTSKPRQATVVASSDTVNLLTVHRKVFQRVLGPLEEILKRNIASYTKFVAGVNIN